MLGIEILKGGKDKKMYEIKIKIHEETDLYNPLDPEQILLSDELVSYILRKYEERPDIRDKHVIHIYSDTPVEEERVKRNIRRYTEEEGKIIVRKQKTSRLKQVRLFIIGLAFIAFWLFMASITENIIVEVLSIIGSFAVWEAANIWIVELPAQRVYRRRLARLEDTEVLITVIEKQ